MAASVDVRRVIVEVVMADLLTVVNSRPTKSTIAITTTPTADAVPQAGTGGTLDAGWLGQTGGAGQTTYAMNFGDGRDGTITLLADGSSSYTGISWDAGRSEYYLTKDLQPRALELEASTLLAVRGFRIFAYESITLGASARIHADGYNASSYVNGSGSPPASTTGATMAGGGGGASGRNTGNTGGSSSSAISSTIRAGAQGGGGGAVFTNGSQTFAGGAAGAGTAWVEVTHGARSLLVSYSPRTADGSALKAAGGFGGGGGGVASNAVSGGGGGGAGVVVVTAPIVIFGSSSKITANGGTGGNATASTNQMGAGGGGGGGGEIIFKTGSVVGTATLEANGGNGGNGAANHASTLYYAAGGSGGSGGWVEAFAANGTLSASVNGGTAGTAGIANGGTGTNGVNGSAGTTVLAPAA